MANEEMSREWDDGGLEWVRNEAIFDAAFAEFSAALLAATDPGASHRVLDVGCGSGGLLAEIAARGSEVVGVDISESMAAAARRRTPSATVVTGDAQTLELDRAAPGRPFDRIVSRFGVMFFDDPIAAFANLRSVAAPGATLAVVCWRAEEVDMFRQGLGPLLRSAGSPPPEFVPDRVGPLGLATEPWIRQVLDTAGWERIDVVPLDATCRFAVGDGDGIDERLEVAVGGMTGRALRAELEPRLGADGWARLLDEARDELREHLVDGTFEAVGRTWVVTAVAP